MKHPIKFNVNQEHTMLPEIAQIAAKTGLRNNVGLRSACVDGRI